MRVLTATAALFILLKLSFAADDDSCDYHERDPCINVQTKASATVEFKPLFPTNPTFVHAIDDLDEDEKETELTKGNFSGLDPGPLKKLGFWLEYEEINEKEESTFNVVGLYSNASGTVGGGNNGCNDYLGEECAENLKEVLAWGAVSAGDRLIKPPLLARLYNFRASPLTNLSCPADLFQYYTAETFNITGDDKSKRPFSGNSSVVYDKPYVVRESAHWNSAIGILAQYPAVNATYDDVKLEIVCAQLESDDDDDDEEEDEDESSSEPKGAAYSVQIPSLLIIGMLGLVLAF